MAGTDANVSTRERPTTHGRRAELLVLLASVVVTLGLLELGVRALAVGVRRPTGYAPVKNRLGVGPKNSRGYRDEERVIPKPPGVHRVLSLGDSFAWGFGIEYGDAYPQRLERLLTRRRRERWEVVNLAIPGLNSVHESEQLLREGFAYEPDIVVLGYVLNDSQVSAAVDEERAAEFEAHQARHLRQPSALVRFVDDRLFAAAEARRRVDGYQALYQDAAPGWVAGQQALRTMAHACREHGIPFLVAVFPLFGNPLDDTYPFENIHRKVDGVVQASGGYVVDLWPEYRGLRWDLLVVNGERDEHPNEIGHRIAADVLLPRLGDLLPPVTSPDARP